MCLLLAVNLLGSVGCSQTEGLPETSQLESSQQEQEEQEESGKQPPEVPEGVRIIDLGEDLEYFQEGMEELEEAIENMEPRVYMKNCARVDWSDMNVRHFWLSGIQDQMNGYERDGEYFFEGYVSFTYNCTAEEIPEMQAEIDETAEEILSKIPSGADQWEAARIIHDELCRRVTYDQSLEGEHIRDIYGALAEGSAVCVGYAYAFDYLMEKAVSDSSCSTLESDDRTHAWNLVRFQEGDDDYALFLDVTWDDTDL